VRTGGPIRIGGWLNHVCAMTAGADGSGNLDSPQTPARSRRPLVLWCVFWLCVLPLVFAIAVPFAPLFITPGLMPFAWVPPVVHSIFLGPARLVAWVFDCTDSGWSLALFLAQIISYIGFGYHRYRGGAAMPLKWALLINVVAFPFALFTWPPESWEVKPARLDLPWGP
jgi:hypothetical protein